MSHDFKQVCNLHWEGLGYNRDRKFCRLNQTFKRFHLMPLCSTLITCEVPPSSMIASTSVVVRGTTGLLILLWFDERGGRLRLRRLGPQDRLCKSHLARGLYADTVLTLAGYKSTPGILLSEAVCPLDASQVSCSLILLPSPEATSTR